jgi:hypothetical protein
MEENLDRLVPGSAFSSGHGKSAYSLQQGMTMCFWSTLAFVIVQGLWSVATRRTTRELAR